MSKYLKIAEGARRTFLLATESATRDVVSVANSGKDTGVEEARSSTTTSSQPATKETEATKAPDHRAVAESAPATKATKAEAMPTAAGFRALTVGNALKEIKQRGSGPAKNAELYWRGELSREKAIEYITCAILHRRGKSFEGWRRHAPAVEVALTHPLSCECEECL